tara:strand:+ start:393 stop:755 length:363 start_codon:yes stop_codon:yes gene_type:complete
MKSKHTKGTVVTDSIKGYPRGGNPPKVCNSTGGLICEMGGGEIEEVEANAQLVADAFNVTNETNKTPRELQKSHDELLKRLDMLSDFANKVIQHNSDPSDILMLKLEVNKSNRAIKNAKP